MAMGKKSVVTFDPSRSVQLFQLFLTKPLTLLTGRKNLEANTKPCPDLRQSYLRAY